MALFWALRPSLLETNCRVAPFWDCRVAPFWYSELTGGTILRWYHPRLPAGGLGGGTDWPGLSCVAMTNFCGRLSGRFRRTESSRVAKESGHTQFSLHQFSLPLLSLPLLSLPLFCLPLFSLIRGGGCPGGGTRYDFSSSPSFFLPLFTPERPMPTVTELYDEANRLKRENKLEEAVALLNQVLAQDDKHVLTYSALGVILQRLGRLDEAVANARKVCELEPNDPFSFTQLSVICQRCGRIQDAEDAMARAHMLQGSGRRH